MHNTKRPPERCSAWPMCDICRDIPAGDPFFITAELIDGDNRRVLTLCDEAVFDDDELVYLNRDGDGLKKSCPDGGVCHHRCGPKCWRVMNAAPLAPFKTWEDAT